MEKTKSKQMMLRKKEVWSFFLLKKYGGDATTCDQIPKLTKGEECRST